MLVFLKAALESIRKIWINEFVIPVKSIRLSYLPPLMVYFAAGVSGLTGVVDSFFVTKVLGMEAAFLAVLGYWAGIWWAFKMPLGNLVDRFWRFKAVFVAFGAVLMGLSFAVMVGLTGNRFGGIMKYMSAETWYIVAALITPFAYILQDVVADAMTVEAVSRVGQDGTPVGEAELKSEHTTMQLLGRAAILFGALITAGAAGWFAKMPAPETGFILTKVLLLSILAVAIYEAIAVYRRGVIGRKIKAVRINFIRIVFLFAYVAVVGIFVFFVYWVASSFFAYKFSAGGWLASVKSYEMIYWLAMLIPLMSMAGVVIAAMIRRKKKKEFMERGFSSKQIVAMLNPESEEKKELNWWIMGGSVMLLCFVVPLGLLSLTYQRHLKIVPLSGFIADGGLDVNNLPFGLGAWLPAHADTLLFAVSFIIISWLIARVTKELPKETRRTLIGTAIVIFVYRMTPSVGAGMSFFNIEILRFEEDFMGTLGQASSIIGLFGLFVLRPMMAKKSLTWIFVFLTFLYTVFLLPSLGLVYGAHKWLAAFFSSDPYAMARTIAFIDTVAVSPFGQLAMVPMLAWISKEAPAKYKATYFAVMASFTNLALSASTLGTKYLNETFVITKPVYDNNNVIVKPGIYNDLGPLTITVGLISLILPLVTILFFTNFRGKPAIGFRAMDAVNNFFSRMYALFFGIKPKKEE